MNKRSKRKSSKQVFRIEQCTADRIAVKQRRETVVVQIHVDAKGVRRRKHGVMPATLDKLFGTNADLDPSGVLKINGDRRKFLTERVERCPKCHQLLVQEPSACSCRFGCGSIFVLVDGSRTEQNEYERVMRLRNVNVISAVADWHG